MILEVNEGEKLPKNERLSVFGLIENKFLFCWTQLFE